MKTWEMIKALTENQELTFKNIRFGGIVGYIESGVLSWLRNTNKDGEAFTIHFVRGDSLNGNWNDDWELMCEPVDFMTAINSGERIRSEFWKPGEHIGTDIPRDEWFRISADEINGKWYIKNREE